MEFRSLARMGMLALALATGGCAVTGRVSQIEPVTAVNLADCVAIKGYDPVSYLASSQPEKGDPRFTATWEGATYRFASAAHRDAFLANPSRYTPQYGGFCAFAISRGDIADIDPDSWAVVDDKLYLNNNSFAQTLWDADRKGNIKAGDTNWPLVPKLPPRAP